ncbi:MAG: hypothetical protein C0503_10030, partial [Gemmatimonas sp.]|nr:hypothetical protein [Gemmatimonas sp.]
MRDEWMWATLEGLLEPDQVEALRAAPPESLWEDVVRRGWLTDDAVVKAVAARFRMRIADLASVSQQARELVPEALARKFR